MADCQACHRTGWRRDGRPCFDCIGGIASCCDGAVPLDETPQHRCDLKEVRNQKAPYVIDITS